ncbi:beta-1,3-galactosyltransferase brn [Stomoxys calcitrans]|uniref:beta-1,3-galactosyltransferase brn n=1 Tax=Stomoxys calcitrans TaxID=35570 RepID=UPI0027E289CD|nr:beta-1,3-galactosyltransferase brn [Stomoxys calcitrans]
MRLRRIIWKLILIIAAFLIALVIVLNNTENTTNSDEFLTILRNTKEDDVVVTPGEPPPKMHLLDERKPKPAKAQERQLLNLTNFEYMVDNYSCENYKKELMAIIIVTSYVGHDELRSAHRNAISQAKLSEMGMQRVFLLATISRREHFITQSQIFNEQQRFGDLLQGNFLEAYRNLSYKHIMGLEWAARRCSKAKFIIKIDDDIVYDVFHLKRYLESLELENHELTTSNALLAGYILDEKPVIRNEQNKWYVSPEEYNFNVYPSYLSGWLYVTNPKTALRLVDQAYNTPIFWIDDTWVTGILREPLHIPLQRLNSWFSANPDFLQCCVRDLKKANAMECEFYVGPNGGEAKLLIEFLHNVEKCYYDECLKRPKEQSIKNTCVGAVKRILPDHGNAEIKMVSLGR